MVMRRYSVLLLIGTLASMGASYQSTNFTVHAATPQIAQHIGQWAEFYRKEKAIQWLGREMPQWPEPCPVRVTITPGGAGGATTFSFMGSHVSQYMNIEGPLDRLKDSVLPHEVTHTVFAHYFRRPVPRWADEGGAVLSEDDLERGRHDQMVRGILNANKAIPLQRLFALTEYPQDVGSLYAEGYSVSAYLVGLSDRPSFLNFVAHGMQYGWDSAAQTHYHKSSVKDLENAWLQHLLDTKKRPEAILAQNTNPRVDESANRVVVRLTAPPTQPLQDSPAPIFRAQAPDNDRDGGWGNIARQPATSRPGYLPESAGGRGRPNARQQQSQPAADSWQPVGVRLGAPQFGVQAESRQMNSPAVQDQRRPAAASPIGYPQ